MTDPRDGFEAARSSGDGNTSPVPGSDSVIAQFDATTAGGTDVEQDLLPERLSRAVADVLDVEGAAISVYLGGDLAVPVGASNAGASVGEALQFTLREGPCFDAYASRCPVLMGDLREPGSAAWSRWPMYALQLIERTPYHGVFAYPLLGDGSAFGSLTLYRHASGTPAYLNDVPVIAERVAAQLLDAELFTGPDGEPVHQWMEGPIGNRRRLVWVAQGMTVEANQVTPVEALDLLRAQAFTADRLLDETAADIVAGRLAVPVLDAS